MGLCNSHQNAIEIVDLRNGNAVTTLAQNADIDGIRGLFDCTTPQKLDSLGGVC